MEHFEEIKALIGERVTEDDFGRVFKKETGTTPGGISNGGKTAAGAEAFAEA